MLADRIRPATASQYLAFERGAGQRHELVDGQIVAMSGASRAHNLINLAVASLLRTRLKGRGCETYASDMRVKVAALGLYTYSDVAVVCGGPQLEDENGDTLLNPLLLVEVLSPSTEAYDRGYKARAYRMIPSLACHVILAQDRPMAEVYTRQSEQWSLVDVSGLAAQLDLPALGISLPMAEIYADLAPAATLS